MCRTNNGLWFLAFLMCVAALLVCVALFSPNDHVRDKHPEVTNVMDTSSDDAFKCWVNGEKKLYVWKPITGCPTDTKLGVITTEEGDIITGFFAKWKYWAKVIARDGYVAQ